MDHKRFYRKMKFWITCICTLILSLSLIHDMKIYPQSGLEMSVYGFVRDLDTNQALEGISVYFFRIKNDELTETFEGTSDKNGFYKARYKNFYLVGRFL